MATYTKVSNSIPSPQRAALITDVAAGDQIDLRDVLGRAARKVIFHVSASADDVSYKVNHLRRLTSPPSGVPEGLTGAFKTWGTYGTSRINVWSGTGSTFTVTGADTVALTLESPEGLSIDSLEVTALALSVGTKISITVM